MQKVNLCENCSKEKGVNDPTGFALADLLLGLGAAQEIEKNPAGVRCPVCGFSQVDFKKTGRLGCSACYDAFAEGLTGMLKNMHRGLVHAGKVPVKLALARRQNQERTRLQEGLARAIEEEHFEEAASLRDKIRRLEEEVAQLEEEKPEEVNRITGLTEALGSSAAPSSDDTHSAPKSRKKS